MSCRWWQNATRLQAQCTRFVPRTQYTACAQKEKAPRRGVRGAKSARVPGEGEGAPCIIRGDRTIPHPTSTRGWRMFPGEQGGYLPRDGNFGAQPRHRGRYRGSPRQLLFHFGGELGQCEGFGQEGVGLVLVEALL